MEKKCKNPKCQKVLPEGYKYNRCENCRNKNVKKIKKAVGVAGLVGTTVIAVVTKGKINLKNE